MLTWKIVGVSKVSVLYIYIDKQNQNESVTQRKILKQLV